MKFFREYMEAFKNGTKAASPYRYFPTDERRAFFEESPGYIVSYEILHSEQINDRLTAVTFSYVNNRDKHLEWTSFVAKMDDKYYVIANLRDVPEEFSENLDVDSYTDPDDMWIGFDETEGTAFGDGS